METQPKEEKMADETKKTEPETTDVEAAEDRIGEALEKFGNEAEAALTEIRGVAKTLKADLTRAVLARADEQSAVMKSTETEIVALRLRFDDQRLALETLSSSVAKVDAAVKDTKRRMGEQGEAVKKVLDTAKAIDAKAGDLFGRKLEALASQVAPIAAMGERLVKAEQAAKDATDAVRKEHTDLALLNDEIRKLRSEVARLAGTVESLKPKAEKPKAAEAS
jgi:chromosome segregation ATPase